MNRIYTLFLFALVGGLPFSAQAQMFSAESGIQALLVPARHAVLSSRIGEMVASVSVENGDSFAAGDVLLRFDCAYQEADLRAALAQAKAAEQAVKANRKLKKLDSISEMELMRSEADLDGSKADVAKKQAIVTRCTIAAPFDGRILMRDIQPFETVDPGRALLEIASNDPLRARFLAPASWLSWMQKGTPVSLLPDGTTDSYKGEIIKIGGGVDDVSQSVEVTAVLTDMHAALRPGMSARITFPAVGEEE
jgi:RND family efflux transporter MFP subunit